MRRFLRFYQYSKPLCLPQAPPGVLKNHFCEKTSGFAEAQPEEFYYEKLIGMELMFSSCAAFARSTSVYQSP